MTNQQYASLLLEFVKETHENAGKGTKRSKGRNVAAYTASSQAQAVRQYVVDNPIKSVPAGTKYAVADDGTMLFCLKPIEDEKFLLTTPMEEAHEWSKREVWFKSGQTHEALFAFHQFKAIRDEIRDIEAALRTERISLKLRDDLLKMRERQLARYQGLRVLVQHGRNQALLFEEKHRSGEDKEINAYAPKRPRGSRGGKSGDQRTSRRGGQRWGGPPAVFTPSFPTYTPAPWAAPPATPPSSSAATGRSFGSSSGGRKSGACHVCGETGHYQAACPKRTGKGS